MTTEHQNSGAENSISEAKRALLKKRLQRSVKAKPLATHSPRHSDNEPRRASIGQSRIWLLDRMDEGSAANNITSSFRIESAVNCPALAQAFTTIVSRHEILRSCYRLKEDTIVQEDVEGAKIELEQFQCNTPEEAYEQARQFGKQAIDIEKGPLLRLGLFSASETKHVLILVVHDIAFDKWSLLQFWREFSISYANKIQNTTPPLKPATYQFSDFSRWQREWFNKEREMAQIKYWIEKLKNPPPPIPLPTDHPYPQIITKAGRLEYGTVSSNIASKLKSISSNHDVSNFTTLLLAFSILLGKYSETNDILVSSPVANRRTKDTADLIGFLLNTLVLRTKLLANQTFSEGLAVAKKTVYEALENQDLPTDKIVEALKPDRTQGRHPLFQTMFVYQREDEGTPKLELLGCEIEPIFLETETSKFDLSLFVAEDGDGFKTVAEYRTDLFEPSTIQRFLEHFSQLLLNIVSDPNQLIQDLEYLTPAELSELKAYESGPQLAPSEASTILDLFKKHQNSSNIALSSDKTRYTYQELAEKSDVVAQKILSEIETKNAKIAVFIDQSPEAIIAVLGILKAGSAYMAIDTNSPKNRIDYIISDAEIKTILCSQSTYEVLANNDCRKLVIEKILLENNETSTTINLSEPENDAYVIYTSGSTGQAKGVPITHKSLLTSTLARIQYYENAPETFLLIPSLSFDSSIAGLFWTLCTGGTLVVPGFEQIRDPESLINLISEESVDSILAIPTLYDQILKWSPKKLATLKRVIVAGEACSEQLISTHHRHLPKATLFNEYGPTEATVWATVHRFSEQNINPGPVPIGKPIPGVEIRVLDNQYQRRSCGVIGELCISGPTLTRGYLNQATATSNAFIQTRDGKRFYKTGDLARWSKSGELEFHGRSDEQVKVRGYRIEIGEIESAIRGIKGIKDVAVVAVSSSVPIEEDHRELDTLLASVDQATLENALNLVLEPASKFNPATTNRRVLKRDQLEITFDFKKKEFINPPRRAQRDWLLAQAINEIADDLEHLDKIAPLFVAGKNHQLDKDLVDITDTRLDKNRIMEDWQTPLMKEMSTYVTSNHGNVLEIGFGLGVSASFIQEQGVASHTIIEMNGPCVENHFKPWKERYPNSDIHLHHSTWQDALPNLGLFDGILFHAFPMNEKEFVDYVLDSVTFAEHAFEPMSAHLKPGGTFTYLTTEIDSLSRRHQRSLMKHFSGFSCKPVPLSVPEDTIDTWWAGTMMAIKAIK